MTAREAAAEILHLARIRRAFVEDVLDEVLTQTSFDKDEDRRLCAHLALGVTRRRATLDALIEPHLSRPWHAIEPRVVDVLHLGAYQLALLTQIPPHAAVHETVDLARVVGSPMAKGFVNGGLRRVSESVADSFAKDVSPFHLPLDDGRFRILNAPLLPDPRREPSLYLSAAFSWPFWLADQWLHQHGFDECVRLGFWFNAVPPLWVRVKPSINLADYQQRLAGMGITATPGPHPQSLCLPNGVSVPDLPGYAHGDFAVQDHAAMLAASALNPLPGMTVLDLCAAPGGKTTHLAELMHDTGTVVACDIDDARLATINSLAERLKLTCIKTVRLAEGQLPPEGPFDAALVDVPCSNTGVLGRRVDVRWRLQPREFPFLITLQTTLLKNAIDRVNPGGVIVYSTCSIDAAENAGVVDAVCRELKIVRKEADHTSVPGRPADGGYWARLLKRG